MLDALLDGDTKKDATQRFTPSVASFFTLLRPSKTMRIGTWGAMASAANVKSWSAAGRNAKERSTE